MGEPKPKPRGLVHLFMMIAEPRVARVIQLFVYLAVLAAGIASLFGPPQSVVWVLGSFLAAMQAVFLMLGGVFGTIAVLPGIWWLERAAVIATCTGLAFYALVAVTLIVNGADPGMQLFVTLALIASQAHRWTQIRRYQLAPKG